MDDVIIEMNCEDKYGAKGQVLSFQPHYYLVIRATHATLAEITSFPFCYVETRLEIEKVLRFQDLSFKVALYE